MAPIETLVERYDKGHSSKFNRGLHIIGIILFNLGILSLFWAIPNGPVVSWLGPHQFANWATVYSVLMIIYFGSQSFSLTFAGGIFYQGGLFAISYLVNLDLFAFPALIGMLLISGLILMLIGHLVEGNFREIKKDIIYCIIAPTWIFRFIYSWLGVGF